MHWSFERDVWHATVSWHVEQYAAGDDPIAELVDVSKSRAVKADLDIGVAAVPHPVLGPHMA
jgi:hypothetical protein